MALAILLLAIIGISAAAVYTAVAYTVQQKEDKKNSQDKPDCNPETGEVSFPKSNMEIATDYFMRQGELTSTPDINSAGHFERPGWQDNVVDQVPVWVNDGGTKNIDLGIPIINASGDTIIVPNIDEVKLKKLTRTTKRQPMKPASESKGNSKNKSIEKKYKLPTTKKAIELKPKDFVQKTKEIGNPIAKVVPGKKKAVAKIMIAVDPKKKPAVKKVAKVEPVKKVIPVPPVKPKKK
jgi:hypothetical protein